jgi:hypothetical protein
LLKAKAKAKTKNTQLSQNTAITPLVMSPRVHKNLHTADYSMYLK